MVERPEQDDDVLLTRLRSALGLEQEVALRQRLEEQTAGEYELLETLGSGVSGVVFKARDLKLDRFVAIKALANSGATERLAAVLQEARTMARLSHPNIAAIHAVCEKPESPFIVMEFVDGTPITDSLSGQSIVHQVEAFAKVLRGVAELHRYGIVHRDLKPANILVDRHGNPKIVDFGIADTVAPNQRGRAEGTPAYLSPEQAVGAAVSPSADVFSLGVILFELLTGQRPFPGQTGSQVLAAVRDSDPPLPRSLREEIPGPLQAICLTALEKDPARRYPSAREFELDVARFLNGEAVTADPSLLTNILDHGIERHTSDIQRWQKDRMISTRECDYFLDKYGRLRQREEFWVLDSRRISFSQVMLHLGAWSCAVSAFLMLAFPWPQLGGARPVLPAALVGILLCAGLVLWRWRTNRVAIVLLMGAAITCPLAVATALVHFHALSTSDLDTAILPGLLNNQQLLASTLVALSLSLLLWWHTRTGAFAIISVIGILLVTTASFGLAGLRQQLTEGHIDTVAGWYLAPAVALLIVAMAWDLRWKTPSFASPFYVAGLAILLLSLTLIARFGPTPAWLALSPRAAGEDLTRQIDYSFMLNGLLYLAAGLVADRSPCSRWLRRIGTILLWLAPSHLLIPIWRLENQWPILSSSWTLAELLLPVGALAFVFASVPKQMKSFFFSGLFYLAIAVQRLTSRHFQDDFAWPLALALTGLALALLAWRRPSLFDKKTTR